MVIPVIERVLAHGEVFAVESVGSDVLCYSKELVDGIYKRRSGDTVHVERNWDAPA